MRVTRSPRQEVLSVRVTKEMRRLVERLARTLAQEQGRPYTLTDVMEECIRDKARKEKVK